MTDVAILGELAYWQQTGIRVGAGLAAVLLVAGTLVYLHLFKLVSFMQSRLGPMEAGPFGSLQLLAEVGKFLQKEDIFPRKADRFVFAAAPFVVLMSTFLLVVVVPGGPDAWFVNSELGIYLAMAVSSVSVIGILMAGWGSASKYSLLGGLRATGQLIAYELPLILAVMGVVIQAETMNMQGIVQAQADGEIFGWGGIGNPYILTQFVAFVIFTHVVACFWWLVGTSMGPYGWQFQDDVVPLLLQEVHRHLARISRHACMARLGSRAAPLATDEPARRDTNRPPPRAPPCHGAADGRLVTCDAGA